MGNKDASTGSAASGKTERKHVFYGRNLKAEALARSDTVGALLARRDHPEADDKRLSLREHTFLFLADPSSSYAANAFGKMMWLVILTSSFSYVYETMRWATDQTGPEIWLYSRLFYQIFYTIEAGLRVVSFIPFRKVYKDEMVMLDVLTVVPFWLRFAFYPESLTAEHYLDNTSRSMSIRIMESMAAIRLIKLTRYYEGAQLIALAIMKSLSQLLVPLFMLFAMVFLFSMIIYDIEWDSNIERCRQLWSAQGITNTFFESHGDGISWGCESCGLEASTLDGNATLKQYCQTCDGYPPGAPECLGVPFTQTFTDMPAAMWFTVVTVTTVGYGDVSPTTWRGQLFSVIVILTGVIFLAMPLAIVGNNFTSTFEERALIKLQKLVRQLLVDNGISAADVVVAYRQIDDNGDGVISFQEFVEFCTQRLRLVLPKPELYTLWRQIDINGSGVINFSEFTSVIFPNVDLDTLASEATSAGEIKNLTEAQGDDEDGDGVNLVDQRAEMHQASFVEAKPSNGAAQTKPTGSATAVLSRVGFQQAKKMDRTPGGIDGTLEDMLGLMRRLQASMDAIDARVNRIEEGQAALSAQFHEVDGSLKKLRASSVHGRISPSGHDADFREAQRQSRTSPMKDSPPHQHRRRRTQSRSAMAQAANASHSNGTPTAPACPAKTTSAPVDTTKNKGPMTNDMTSSASHQTHPGPASRQQSRAHSPSNSKTASSKVASRSGTPSHDDRGRQSPTPTANFAAAPKRDPDYQRPHPTIPADSTGTGDIVSSAKFAA